MSQYDVIIIGGSYAGLSAALSLGRSLRHVLILDSGEPCNKTTPHSHNFLTHDGQKPEVIAQKAKEEVLQYKTVTFVKDEALNGAKTDNGFLITTRSGASYTAGKLIFATGIRDTTPDIKGFSACWGISVVHCPYCHGYELRDKKIAIIANGEKAMHLSGLVHHLTKHVTIFTNGEPHLTHHQLLKLEHHQIPVIETHIAEIDHYNGQATQAIFCDGTKVNVEGIFAAVPFVQHSDIPVSLGCELTEQGYIRIDDFHQTNIHGVFACGDNSNMMRSLANAVYSGNLTGAMVNMHLVAEKH